MMYACKVFGRKFKSIKARGGRASMSVKFLDVTPLANFTSKYSK